MPIYGGSAAIEKVVYDADISGASTYDFEVFGDNFDKYIIELSNFRLTSVGPYPFAINFKVAGIWQTALYSYGYSVSNATTGTGTNVADIEMGKNISGLYANNYQTFNGVIEFGSLHTTSQTKTLIFHCGNGSKFSSGTGMLSGNGAVTGIRLKVAGGAPSGHVTIKGFNYA